MEEADIYEKKKILKFKTEKWKDRWDLQETARVSKIVYLF